MRPRILVALMLPWLLGACELVVGDRELTVEGDAGDPRDVLTDSPRVTDAHDESRPPCDPSSCEDAAMSCAQACMATETMCATQCDPGPSMGCMKQCGDTESQCQQKCSSTCASCITTSAGACPQTNACSMATR